MKEEQKIKEKNNELKKKSMCNVISIFNIFSTKRMCFVAYTVTICFSQDKHIYYLVT